MKMKHDKSCLWMLRTCADELAAGVRTGGDVTPEREPKRAAAWHCRAYNYC
jgi:hypothetical protein